MKIVVATIGSRGDVQPYINLCQGLQARGHTVTLATNPTLCALADAHGLKSIPVGPAVDMGRVGAQLMAASFNNMWIGMIRTMQLAARLVEEAYPDVLRACAGADLVITSDSTSGIAEAEKLGLPWISVTLQPARVPVENPKLSWTLRIAFGLLNQLFVLPINRSRQRLGAPPVTDVVNMLSRRMILLPVSPYIAAPDPRWPKHVYQTGYWFAHALPNWSPPPDLLNFLAAGDKPIVVSLGVMSLSGQQARASARIVLTAIRQADVRAIVQGWDEAVRDLDLPSTVYHAGSLPHSWLFEQAQAIVHHGGFGTTAAALRSGVPSIVIPHVVDQFYWGQRVYALGVGPKFITRGKLNVRNLRTAITQAVQSAPLRANAAALGRSLQAEADGITTAVTLIETKL